MLLLVQASTKRSVFRCLLAIGLIGCTEAPAPVVGGAEDLSLAIHVTPTTLGPTDTASVVVVAANRTDHLIAFVRACSGPFYYVRHGASVIDGPGLCLASQADSLLRLAPGDSMVAHLRFDVYRWSGPDAYKSLAPGVYEFSGAMLVGGEPQGETSPVTVTITG